MELKVIEFIKQHDNWKELLSASPYYITIKEKNDYYLLKYNQIDSDFTLDIVKECRGLIIDKCTLKPKALSFVKFFNIEEPNADRIAWRDCRVQEKVDGSKILVWFDKDRDVWRVSTSGEINAYEANVNDFGFTYGYMFDQAIKNNNLTKSEFYGLLNPNYCYTFELVSPETRIVIKYNKADIRFIGLRDTETFEELNPDIETSLCEIIKRPKEFNIHSMKGCIEAAKNLHLDQEGFVVVDYKWRRVKVKSPDYVQAHYLRCNGIQNQGRLLEIVESGEKNEFCAYFSEWKDKLNEIENTLNNFKKQLHMIIDDIQGWIAEEHCNQKQLAEYINTNYSQFKSFLFKYFKSDMVRYFIDHEWKELNKDKKFEYLNLRVNDTQSDKTILDIEE